MRVDMQGPVWLSGGEDGFYASALFLGLLVNPRMGCAAPVPLPEFNVNPPFSEGLGGQNYRWLTMDVGTVIYKARSTSSFSGPSPSGPITAGVSSSGFTRFRARRSPSARDRSIPRR